MNVKYKSLMSALNLATQKWLDQGGRASVPCGKRLKIVLEEIPHPDVEVEFREGSDPVQPDLEDVLDLSFNEVVNRLPPRFYRNRIGN